MPSLIKTDASCQSFKKRREESRPFLGQKEGASKKPQLKRIKCCCAITCPVDLIAAEASVVSTADGVPAEEVDEQRGPSLPVSCRGLLVTRALRNPDRNICRGPVGREPVERKNELNFFFPILYLPVQLNFRLSQSPQMNWVLHLGDLMALNAPFAD